MERRHPGPGSTLDCPGVFFRPGDFSHTPFPNWTTADLGNMDLRTALEQSCNTFFFQLGSKMYDLPNQGIAFQKTIRQYGFGKTPPMDLPVSPYFSGLVPDPAWRLQTYSKPIDQVWQPGYDIQMAIGQGDLTVSPMQLAVAYSAIANGGKLVTPHIGKALLDSQGKVVKRFDPRPQRDLNLSPTLLSEIRRVCMRPATARWARPARCSVAIPRPSPVRPVPPSIHRTPRQTRGSPRSRPRTIPGWWWWR